MYVADASIGSWCVKLNKKQRKLLNRDNREENLKQTKVASQFRELQ